MAANVRSVIVGLDLRDGKEVGRVGLSGKRSLGAGYVTKGLLVAERPRCSSDDRAKRLGDDVVAAVDPTSGQTRWRRTDAVLDGAMGAAPPGLGTVLVDDSPASAGRVRALNPSSGRERWSDVVTTNRVLAVDDDMVLVSDRFGVPAPDGGAQVRARDLRNGSTRWDFTVMGAAQLEGSIGEGLVAVFDPFPTGGQRLVTILDASDGTPVTTISIPVRQLPRLVGTVLVVVDPDNQLTSGYDARSGTKLWELKDAEAVAGSDDPLVTAAQSEPLSYSGRDVRTSNRRWRVAVDGYSGVLQSRDVSVMLSDKITAVESASGSKLWSIDSPSLFTTHFPDGDLQPISRTFIGNDTLLVAGGCVLTTAT